MKKLFICFCLIIVMISSCMLSACSLFANDESKSYDVSNDYFQKHTYKTSVLTSVGVNGHQGSGTSYQIEVSTKSTLDLFECSVHAELFSSSNKLLYTFDKTLSRSFAANTSITFYEEISYEVYSQISYVNASFTGKSHTNPISSNGNGASKITTPIESISLDKGSHAVTIGATIKLNATVTPSNTDDYIVWSSTNEHVLTVNDGIVTAVGVGTAGITVKAANGKVYDAISIKVMSNESTSVSINKCKAKESAILTIKNYCYNTFLGITTKSETRTFTATIVKQSGTSYYFVTGYDGFQKIDGYDYQKWTAIDYNGKEYTLNSIQYERDLTLGNNYRIAIGSINAYNLGVINIESHGYYYLNERLFVSNGSTYIVTSMAETVATHSPVTCNLSYNSKYYGSPVFDSDINFVGFIIREDVFTGKSDFIATWHILKFVRSCGLA